MLLIISVKYLSGMVLELAAKIQLFAHSVATQRAEIMSHLPARIKQRRHPCVGVFLLSYLDSNQDKLIQSQMCYRYTIGQSLVVRLKSRTFALKSGCKSTNFFRSDQIFFSQGGRELGIETINQRLACFKFQFPIRGFSAVRGCRRLRSSRLLPSFRAPVCRSAG